MNLPQEKLKPIKTLLISFTGSVAEPLGLIDIPVAFGKEPQRVDKVVSFLVVNLPSAYNAIIGRPTLNALKAVTLLST